MPVHMAMAVILARLNFSAMAFAEAGDSGLDLSNIDTRSDFNQMRLHELPDAEFLAALAAGRSGVTLHDLACTPTGTWFVVELYGDRRASIRYIIRAHGEQAHLAHFMALPTPPQARQSLAEEILAKVIVGVAEIGLSEVPGYGVIVGGTFLVGDIASTIYDWWTEQEQRIGIFEVKLDSEAPLFFLFHGSHLPAGGLTIEARYELKANHKFDGTMTPIPDVIPVPVC